MAKKIQKKEKDDEKTFAFLATFLSIVGFFIAFFTKRDDKYVMYYAKQSLVIFVYAVIASIISQGLKPIIVIGVIISIVANLFVFILWLLSWINAISGEMKPISIVNYFSDKLNF